MKKDGFTIVELLASVVIIGVITLIAVSGYGTITKNLKDKSYDNLVKYIETKAVDYANESGDLVTNVDNLVKLGYIEADDEEGHVINPVDGSYLNCYLINITNEENNLYGKFTETEECDLENLTIGNMNLKIEGYKTTDNVTKGEKIEGNEWVNTNLILEAILGEKVKEEDVSSIIWQSNVGQDKRDINNDFSSKNRYLVTAEQIVNTEYTATIELKNGISYQTQFTVKIDKQRPILQDVTVDKKEEYTSQNKKVVVTASDGNGSGIYGYYVGPNKNCKDAVYTENHSNKFEMDLDVGTYYVCVKDNAGNLAEDESTRTFTIDKIDKSKPVCGLKVLYGTPGNNGWYISNVAVGFDDARTFDLESGLGSKLLDNQTVANITITEDVWNRVITGVVYDQAGNASDPCTIAISKDSITPFISVKEPTLSLGNIDYDFSSNVNASFGTSGGVISCNPPYSQKTGSYVVTCSAIGYNGLMSTVQFNVRHSYDAKFEGDAHKEQVCMYAWGATDVPCSHCAGGSDNNLLPDGSCRPGQIETESKCCSGPFADEWRCSKGERSGEKCYSCPDGGKLRGTECVYE